ncbi:FtsX-like permease family protein [Methylotetracoccus oryzae]|uniref:FtsX-like permease family protein n=1 Tax=Methylotetracoccus oryzae TaxID=1919059 RepID=UPI0013A5900B|nr:ABC transporter permease [Methylotetracoccus oryzae]
MALLNAANRRFFLRHPWQLALAILGIALGVATAVAVALSVTSARQAFDASMAALLGPTTHQIVASGGVIDESLYPALRRDFPGARFAPVVEDLVETSTGETVRLVGMDPLAAGEGSSGRQFRGLLPLLPALLIRPGTGLLARASAESFGIVPGGVLTLSIQGRPAAIEVLGYLEGNGPADPALEGLLIADIATAQEVLNVMGRLHRIDVVLPADPVLEESLAAALPSGLNLTSAEGRSQATRRLSAAFETNLQAMSMLGLVVGLFLIYNTMMFAVLQRREVLATLRLLGATRREILLEVLVEAVALGVIGSLIGQVLGIAIADLLTAQVTRTINDVYFTLTVKTLFIAPEVLVRGFVLGLGASLLAALMPALEAAGTQPLSARSRSRLEEGNRRWAGWAAAGGLAAIGLATGLWQLPDGTLLRSIVGLFLLLAGCGLMIPAVLSVLGRPLRRIGHPVFRLGVGDVLASLSRTGVAIAALTIAFASALGVGAMTGSFRDTVGEWLDQLMQADLYVTRATTGKGADEPLPPAWREAVASLSGVAAISSARSQSVESSVGRVELVALAPTDPQRSPYRFKSGDRAWQRFLTDDVVVISEPFASRHHLGPGDRLGVVTADGPTELEIAGVFFDYRSDQGIVLIRQPLYARLWRDDGITSLGLVLAPNAAPDAVRKALASAIGRDPALSIRSNRDIRDASLAMFDRTFAITELLRLLAVGVALIGLVSSLLALQLERIRELSVLRALGFTPRQIVSIVMAQSGFIGLASGLLALPLGLLVAWVLVAVIQVQSFGWSMPLRVPYSDLWQTPLLALVAAGGGALLPAWKAVRSTPLTALRDE